MADIKTKIFSILLGVSFLYSVLIPQPQGTSIASPIYNVTEDDVEFLYDLTFDKEGGKVMDQNIFEKAHSIIDSADSFIVMDMFLFNDEYDRKDSYPDVSNALVQKLIEKKKSSPQMEIVIITDEINTFYGSYKSDMMERLKSEGIDVVFTKTEKMKDSNPAYSGLWRLFLNWDIERGRGWIANPFSKDSPKVTLSSYLRLLNFKANHRKVLATENEALISSANPHDASGRHSNIAFAVKGSVINDILAGENVIASWSDIDRGIEYDKENSISESAGESIRIQYITEEKIGSEVTDAVSKTVDGDEINIAMFYLSDRKLIDELVKASNRGVSLNLVLDANKDAFGREKNGIPNRVVASEIFEKTNEKASIKWYKTSGEQFHSKLISVKSSGMHTIFGGSANMTRRNIRGYNLEADIKIISPEGSRISTQIDDYFKILYDGEEEKLLEYEEYAQNSLLKKLIYRFQEWSGISTF
ncbi:PLD-like domain-containing protein [Peptoclostridium litorale DSM 5388]|uniref:Phospholipase D-like domain-containing protein n=1 Tax=Peptoclostridium litorale DSM 5388 TaxID=1121324 RepID=A0A069RLU1_PEPLI|nr:phospholipase D-like domain-containing protein [Peptoclostridium litorale]KDR95142.1 hypothetical protein CLIT_11c01710 [Peptoclostridium litorale DSM 5388]SIN74331.1 PLD-like domain-containing protein [Peptoclostridium litorale DSM 5388]